LLNGFNLVEGLSGLHCLPGLKEFLLVQFGPSLDQALLLARQSARQHLNYIDRDRDSVVLIDGVKVGTVMRSIRLPEHSYDNAVKPR